MDRALREFRIRGVKTNIPFLENVVNHPDFQAGTRHHVVPGRESRRCSRSPPRRDRATKLLTYLGDVIVNGNPGGGGQTTCPTRIRTAAHARRTILRAPPAGTRQIA